MKKMSKKTAAALFAALMLGTLVACGTDTGSSSSKKTAEDGEKITLTFWQAALVQTAELELPENERTINTIVQRYMDEHPNVTIQMEHIPEQTTLQNKLKAAVLAGNAPDVANIYSGYVPTSLKDILLDIKDYIPEDDRKNINGWDAVSEDLDTSKATLGYPASGSELGLFLYNKKLVADADVDLEGDQKPKTADEFMAALQKIQDSGVQPIIADESGFNKLYMFSLCPWWVQQSGGERITSNSLGKTKFADDQGFLSSMQYAQQMYEKGYLNEDYTTIADPISLFFNGECALFPDGNWAIANAQETMGDNLGIYVVPNFNDTVKYQNAKIGGIGQCLAVVNSTKYPEESVDFVSFFSNKENSIKFSKVLSKIPMRSDITAADMGWEGNELMEKQLELAGENLVTWTDNSMQPDVMNEYYVQSTQVVMGNLTPEACAKLLDEKATEVNQ